MATCSPNVDPEQIMVLSFIVSRTLSPYPWRIHCALNSDFPIGTLEFSFNKRMEGRTVSVNKLLNNFLENGNKRAEGNIKLDRSKKNLPQIHKANHPSKLMKTFPHLGMDDAGNMYL